MMLWMWACRKPAPPPEPAPSLVAPPIALAGSPAGSIHDEVYVDREWPLSVRVPDGWDVEIGTADATVRATFVDPETRVRVEFGAWRGEAVPRARKGCAWTFTDTARYRAVRVPEAVTVATCTPDDPRRQRVLGWFVGREGIAWSAEAVVPEGALGPGKEAAERVIAGWRLRN